MDEIALMVYPVVLGRGIKLFPDGAMLHLRTLERRDLNDGIVLLRYAVTRNGAIQPGGA